MEKTNCDDMTSQEMDDYLNGEYKAVTDSMMRMWWAGFANGVDAERSRIIAQIGSKRRSHAKLDLSGLRAALDNLLNHLEER